MRIDSIGFNFKAINFKTAENFRQNNINSAPVSFLGQDIFINRGEKVENLNMQILNSMIDDFKKLDSVDAIVLGGSSAAKTADSSSDFDIYIYCKKIPDVQKRREIAEKYSDNPEINNQYFEDGDEFKFRETGKPIDIMYRNIKNMEEHIQRVWMDGCAQMGYTTCFIDNINKSKILFDRNGDFRRLQQKTETPYPEKLRENIIKKNFTFLKDASSSYYKQINSATKRGDNVSVNHRSAAFLASYFDTIFAVNRVLHPGEKRLVDFALKNCEILPEDFEADVETLSIGTPDEKLAAAERMTENLRKLL